MILTRAPLRITFGGGGTDLPAYYRKFGGELVSAAIDKYIYIALHQIFPKEYIIKYSQFERVPTLDEIKHPIIREVLKLYNIDPRTEIVSFADIPDGTGLGSSGAFTVALLKAVATYQRQQIFTQALAEQACDIEINKLGAPIGKQDQYASAFGGITCFKFNQDDSVEISPVKISQDTMHALEDHLLLFFTGYNRSASGVLAGHKKKLEELDKDMLDNLHFTRELGGISRVALEKGDLVGFAGTMHTHWENKRKRSTDISNDRINIAYETARDNGALGGKLIGAGAGGFLMFYAEDQAMLRKAMAKLDMEEVRFKFDFDGAKSLSV